LKACRGVLRGDRLVVHRQQPCVRRRGYRQPRPVQCHPLTFGIWLSMALGYQLGPNRGKTTTSESETDS